MCDYTIWDLYCYLGVFSWVQVLGHKEGLNVMERADPLFLLIGLPTIPMILILGKMVRWEDFFLKLWRKHSSKLPLLSYLFRGWSSQAFNPLLIFLDLLRALLHTCILSSSRIRELLANACRYRAIVEPVVCHQSVVWSSHHAYYCYHRRQAHVHQRPL